MTGAGQSKPRPFRLGVNYWPASSAMAFWQCWDASEVATAFRRMRSAGLDCVRVFLTWADFQARPTVINSDALALLVKTLELAQEAGLGVMPTLFTGHMSGANFLPEWAVGSAHNSSRFRIICDGRAVPAVPKNWFTDTGLLDAQINLASTCAEALSEHPAFVAWDLGNENSNCVVPPNKDSARSWLSAITEGIRRRDPKTPVTIGIHMEDLEQDRHLGPAAASEFCDFLTMHGYPGYASFTAGPTDERLLPYLAQLTRFLGGNKDVFFTEFGVPTQPRPNTHEEALDATAPLGPKLVSEADAAAYIGRGLEALHQSGAMGAMTWCHTDYSPTLFGTPPFDLAPHERSFGMFRADGSAKPVVEQLRKFSLKSHKVSCTPLVDSSLFIDITAEEYTRTPEIHLGRLFHRYCEAAERIDRAQ